MDAGGTPNFLDHTGFVAFHTFAPVELDPTRLPCTHWARSLSGVQMTTRSTRLSFSASAAAAAMASSRLPLHHGPHDHAKGAKRVFQLAGTGPAGLGRCPRPFCRPGYRSLRNDSMTVVGGDAQVGCALLRHRQDRCQHRL